MTETLCTRCVRETFHEEREGRIVCGACGHPSTLPVRIGSTKGSSIGSNAEEVINEGFTSSASSGASTSSAEKRALTSFASSGASTSSAKGVADAEGHTLAVAKAVARLAGLPDEPGTPGDLALMDATLGLSIWREPDGSRWLFRVHDGWPTHPARESLLSAEVFALVRRRECKLFGARSPLLARMRNLMLIETEAMSAPEVLLATLPDDTTPDERVTWDAIGRLLQVRALTETTGEPFAFSSPTMAWVLGVDESVLRRGKHALEQRGLLVRVGTAPGSFGRPTILWHAATPDERPSS